MTPKEAGAWMARVRKLVRMKVLTATDGFVADTLVWCCRTPGQGRAVVPYVKLAKLAGVSKQTAVQAVERLSRSGVIVRVRQRRRVGWASRVAANLYVFATQARVWATPGPRPGSHTESSGLPTTQGLRKEKRPTAEAFEGSKLDLALQGLWTRLQAHPPGPSTDVPSRG